MMAPPHLAVHWSRGSVIVLEPAPSDMEESDMMSWSASEAGTNTDSSNSVLWLPGIVAGSIKEMRTGIKGVISLKIKVKEMN
jgi:hypothetical protein